MNSTDRLRAEAAGLGVPAGELDRGGGLALPGVGVQQHDRVAVEGPVEQQQRLVAADEAGVGHVAQQGRVGLDGVQLGPVERQAAGRPRPAAGAIGIAS